MIHYQALDSRDRELIQVAAAVLERNFKHPGHTVGAAVLCASGQVYAGVNLESCGYGPCAEQIAVGRAVTEGERRLERIVAVGGAVAPHTVLSPCGNCRQLLVDYAPDCWVILLHEAQLVKARARDLIPDAYRHMESDEPGKPAG